jgi:hypothetical protein
MSCPTAAGLVGETIVAVSEPHVILSTKPVLESADAPATPAMSVAIAAAHAVATDRLKFLMDHSPLMADHFVPRADRLTLKAALSRSLGTGQVSRFAGRERQNHTISATVSA